VSRWLNRQTPLRLHRIDWHRSSTASRSPAATAPSCLLYHAAGQQANHSPVKKKTTYKSP